MARYGKKAQETVEEAMEKFKQGKLKSGKSGVTVKNIKTSGRHRTFGSARKGSQGAASSKKTA
jgi:hypothetical protein